jgi:hypothetical protein
MLGVKEGAMDLKRRRPINRRKFLKGSLTLGITALTRRLLGNAAPPARAADVGGAPAAPGTASRAGADDLDYHAYLPFVRSQRPLAHGPSKLGLHTVNPNNAVGFVQSVHNAGAHVALVKAVDDFGYLRRVKEISPETVTVARWNGRATVDIGGDPAQRAADMLYGSDGHMERWKYEKDVVDYWEILNEQNPPSIAGHVWLAQFFIAAMDIAEANGYKLALFSYSGGVPQWHKWEAIVETGIFAQAKERGHILALHEYNWPTMDLRWGEPTEDLPPYEDRGVLTGRYRYLYRDFLIPRDEVIPLAITESGYEPMIAGEYEWGNWKPRYVGDMIWYDTKLREDDYVIGAAMFTLGGYGAWGPHNYEELLWPGHPYGGQNFLDYIVSLKDA